MIFQSNVVTTLLRTVITGVDVGPVADNSGRQNYIVINKITCTMLANAKLNSLLHVGYAPSAYVLL